MTPSNPSASSQPHRRPPPRPPFYSSSPTPPSPSPRCRPRQVRRRRSPLRRGNADLRKYGRRLCLNASAASPLYCFSSPTTQHHHLSLPRLLRRQLPQVGIRLRAADPRVFWYTIAT